MSVLDRLGDAADALAEAADVIAAAANVSDDAASAQITMAVLSAEAITRTASAAYARRAAIWFSELTGRLPAKRNEDMAKTKPASSAALLSEQRDLQQRRDDLEHEIATLAASRSEHSAHAAVRDPGGPAAQALDAIEAQIDACERQIRRFDAALLEVGAAIAEAEAREEAERIAAAKVRFAEQQERRTEALAAVEPALTALVAALETAKAEHEATVALAHDAREFAPRAFVETLDRLILPALAGHVHVVWQPARV